MFGLALIISFILGTPWVMLIEAIPAKWNVFNVIWVAGYPILCAEIAPTGSPGYINALLSFWI